MTNGLQDLARAAQRLVHPRIVDDGERARHVRFLAVAFGAPVLAPLTMLADGSADAAIVLVATCAALALAWSAALIAMVSGRLAPAGAFLGLAAAGFVAMAAARSGAPGSPILLLLLALPVEAWWVGRKSGQVRLAGLAAIAAAVAALAAAQAPDASLTPAHWLAPAAWAASLAFRRDAFKAGAAVVQPAAQWERVIDGALLQLDSKGGVLSVSAGAKDLLGLEPSLLGAKGLFDRLHVADRIDYLRALSAFGGADRRESLNLRVRAPAAAPGDGSGYLDLALDLSGEGGSIVGWLRRETRAPRLIPEAPAADASLEIAKSRFLAAVSHELRTPLNAIIGFSDMLLHGLFGPFADPRQREYVGLISESGGHLLNVVNAILDVSKIEAGTYAIRPEPFAFAEAVDVSRSMLTRQAAVKGIEVENHVGEDPEIVADRRAVQQILINLLSNAVKFTPEGGKVTIAAERRPGIFEFSVSDTGIGIAEADLMRLGRPFTQIENDLARAYDGAGLGLSLVKGLVELHHGSMSIESAPGQGTTVRIGLPDSARPAAMLETERNDRQDLRHEALRKYG